jgi:adenylate cyclase
MSQDNATTPKDTEIHSAVERILATDNFKRSRRLSDLLTYLVTEDLEGRGDRIKATTVAADLYMRDGDFDQQKDTIVRVEAGRLRQRLDEYYREDGQEESIIIEIPKGGYRPRYQTRSCQKPSPQQTPENYRNRRPPSRYARIALIAVALAAALALLIRMPEQSSKSTELSETSTVFKRPYIVVLPPDYRSQEPDYKDLPLGMVESLTTTLSKISGLSVMAPNSIHELEGDLSAKEFRNLAAQYGITHIVRGSIDATPEQLLVNIQLVDARDSRILWAEKISQARGSVFNLTEAISLRIANHLAVQLQPDERQRIAELHTTSPEAWVLYRQGLITVMPPNDMARIETARKLFHRAREVDPTFAGSYAGESFSHTAMVLFLTTEARELELKRAIMLAQKAVALDDRFGIGYAMLSFAQLMDNDFEAAMSNARKAVAIQPGEAFSQFILGMNLVVGKAPAKAISALQEAVRLDPLEPRTPYLNQLAIAQYAAQQYQDARASLTYNLERGGPWGPHMQLFMAASLGQLGKHAEARTVITRMLQTYPEFSYKGWLMRWLKEEEQQEETVALLRELGLKSL